jgi:hypothetical protein
VETLAFTYCITSVETLASPYYDKVPTLQDGRQKEEIFEIISFRQERSGTGGEKEPFYTGEKKIIEAKTRTVKII